MFSDDAINELKEFTSIELSQSGLKDVEVIIQPMKHHKAVIADQVILSVLQRSRSAVTSEIDALYEMKDIISKIVNRMKRVSIYQYEKLIIAPQQYDGRSIRYGHKVLRTSDISSKPRWWNW